MSFEHFKKLNKEFKKAMRPYLNPTKAYSINAIIDGCNISNKFDCELTGLIYTIPISLEEEIQIFTVIRPSIQARSIFFNRIFEIHTRLIDSCAMTRQQIVNAEINAALEQKDIIHKSFVYVEFLDAHNMVASFTRQGMRSFYHLAPQQHNKLTLKDEQVAKQMAIAMEINYLTLLSHIFSVNKKVTKSLNWNRSKSDLVELIYALHYCNSFQESVSIAEVSQTLSEAFNVDLDTYNTFKDIKARVKENTKFLDELGYVLNRRMREELQ